MFTFCNVVRLIIIYNILETIKQKNFQKIFSDIDDESMILGHHTARSSWTVYHCGVYTLHLH